jgi:ATP citrate (pro-S)-lyase
VLLTVHTDALPTLCIRTIVLFTVQVPMDYTWARRLGLVRKPANFISSISDDRGDELSYAGMPISEVFSENIGIGGVVSLLWFRRRLPDYATTFIEMILMVSAERLNVR